MKSAPTTYSSESAHDKRNYTAGDLLMRKGTIIAGVLARLLEDRKPLTEWEAVECFRTTNLGSAVRTLKKVYGWPIELVEFPTYLPNGRTVYVTGYRLPQAAIATAYQLEHLRDWLKVVKRVQSRKRLLNNAKAAALNLYLLDMDPPYRSFDPRRAMPGLEGL